MTLRTSSLVAPAPAEAVCVDHLDEASCVADPRCQPDYAACVDGARAPCKKPGPRCTCGESPLFIGCRDVAPGSAEVRCLDDGDCEGGDYCDAFSPDRDPVPRPGVCVASSCTFEGQDVCAIPAPDCGPGQIVGPTGGCWGCFDARTCQLVTNACRRDAECPNGFCEVYFEPSDPAPPEGQPPPPLVGQCAFPTCGDGSTLICRVDSFPTCGAGFTRAVVNGCWACVEARECWRCSPNISCD